MLFVESSGASRTPHPTPPDYMPDNARQNETIPFFVSTLKRMTNKTAGFNLWQKSYYDEVISDRETYLNISYYIQNNPLKI